MKNFFQHSKIIKIYVLLSFTYGILLFNSNFFGCRSGWEQYAGGCKFDTPLSIILQPTQAIPFVLLFILLSPLFFWSAIWSSIKVFGKHTRLFIFLSLVSVAVAGSAGNIIHAKRHPYYWDIQMKGLDMSFFEYIQPAIISKAILFLPYLIFISIFCFYFLRRKI